MSPPREEIEFAPELDSLVMACETICVAECCGIDAFDFSPLHVASAAVRHTGDIDDSKIRGHLLDLGEWLAIVRDTPPDDQGIRCYMPRMNHGFTAESAESFAKEMSSAIACAKDVLDHARSLMNQRANKTVDTDA